MTFTSLTEGLGITLLFPILQVAGFNLANQGHVGHYTGEVRDLLVRSGLRPSLWLTFLLPIFMLLMALRSLFSRVQSVLTFRTVLSYELALGRRLYRAITHSDWLFLVRRRSSDFTHALTAELTRVATCTYLLIGTFSNAILALVYIAIALKLSAGMTSLVLATGAALLLVSRRWMRAVHQGGAAVLESMSEVYSAATEHLQNLKAMKFYDAQTSDLEMFSSLQSSALQQVLTIPGIRLLPHSGSKPARCCYWAQLFSPRYRFSMSPRPPFFCCWLSLPAFSLAWKQGKASCRRSSARFPLSRT